MSREDIERLQHKIAKDPDSKLFVPLAEEYKKAGMIDEAIDILIQGLKKQPHYLSARVSLGKILMGRGLLNEAKEEFLRVIAIIPDNLYAHKKLAEIYQELGDRDNTMNELKNVLNLNPTDEWAVSTLSAFEKEPRPISEVSPEPEIPSPHATISDLSGEVQEESGWAPEISPVQEEIPEEQIPEEEIPSEPQQEEPAAEYHNATPDPEDYIRQGNYHEALAAYETILSEDPDNRQVLQRMAELKALFKILGKDHQAHIIHLEKFLDGIKKRRDEFIGST